MKNLSRAERKEFIESLQSKKDGYTRDSLAILGVKWPPRHGWKRELIDNGFIQSPNRRRA